VRDAKSGQHEQLAELGSGSYYAAQLRAFQAECKASTKGPLSLMVQLTRLAGAKGFPLTPSDFLTENRGQVAGLGGANLKKILKEHGITQTLASEGGRTSRGNMGLMIKYIEFLNALHSKTGAVPGEGGRK